MNNDELFEALVLLEKTKGIPVDYMLEKVTAALQSAAKREFGANYVNVEFDKAKKTMRMVRGRMVCEDVVDPKNQITLDEAQRIKPDYEVGDIVYEGELKASALGRLSSQTGKQVIIQGIREAEKNNLAREYEKKTESVISAIVTKPGDNDNDVYVDTGSSEVLLRTADQIPGEKLAVGQRIRVFVTSVKQDNDSDQVVNLSRTAPQMLKRMLENDIPEIADGTVILKSIAREPGSRTKIAVFSRDENVDAVGSCIGNHGARINAIVEELCGEKIDVIRYSENMEEYIAASLSPAQVIDVDFDGERSAVVHVAGEQLSLAIGKEGQNVRLAAKLTGCKIDIKGIKKD